MTNIILLNCEEVGYTLTGIIESLKKINLPYNIGLIVRNSNNLLNDINACVFDEVDAVLVLRCDHIYDWPFLEIEDPINNNLITQLNYITKPLIFIGATPDTTIYGFFSIYYPIWLTTAYLHTKNLVLSNYEFKPRKYLFSCLSSKPKAFRVANYIKFQQSSYYERSLLTLGNLDRLLFDSYSRIEIFDSSFMEVYTTKILPELPITSSDVSYFRAYNDSNIIENSEFECFNYNNAAYLDSYVNVVTEYTYECQFITEKIVKPILAKQFFVVVASKHTIKLLRELGFDVYDDIIDHSMYDELDDLDRLHGVHKLLDIMQYYDWDDLYLKTGDRREANRNKIINLQFETKFLNTLTEHLIGLNL